MAYNYLVIAGVMDTKPNPLPSIRKRLRVVSSKESMTYEEVLESGRMQGWLPETIRWVEVYTMKAYTEEGELGRQFQGRSPRHRLKVI